MHGECIHCGAPAISGQTRCQRCADEDKKRRQQYAARDEARGICKNTGCSNPVTGKKKYCDACNVASAQRTKIRREDWYKQGLCYYCGRQPHLENMVRCADCNKKVNTSISKMQKKRVAKGLCGACGKEPIVAPGYHRCRTCIDKRRAVHNTLKVEVINAYGGPQCVGCPENDIRILQIDHIDGGGNKHAKQIGGRGRMYVWLKKNNYPPGFRVLCPNCNVRAYRKIPFPNHTK